MPSVLTALFDFTPFEQHREQSIDMIRGFIEHRAFRSAVVDELVLDEDFCRRPLRPEDLSLLPFAEPIGDGTASCLAALASQRMLLSIYELGVARFPRQRTPQELDRFADFHSDPNQVSAARVRPFLENYAFHAVGSESKRPPTTPDCYGRLQQVEQEEAAFWRETLGGLARNRYQDEGLKFALIQRSSLHPTKVTALDRARAAGFFAPVDAVDQPQLAGARPSLAEMLAEALGVHRAAHSYWQFYLATSLAQTNLLCALASRPDRALALYGAAFAAEVEWSAFSSVLAEVCPHIAKGERASRESLSQRGTLARFERVLGRVKARFGQPGLEQVEQGLIAAEQLGRRARRDLGEQLAWLSASQTYCSFARTISERIRVECPNIDRETFVEPREMCSTTHVHDDHRLVVIEKGDMVFWGNIGMRLEMSVGDMVLIPKGRLHGSTVVSEECTYHQPIIMDEWVRKLVQELDATQKPPRTGQALSSLA